MKLEDRIIDASKEGSFERYINHTCVANAEFRKIALNGITRVGVYATKDIRVMEEVTCQYLQFSKQHENNSFPCKCSEGCNTWLQHEY